MSKPALPCMILNQFPVDRRIMLSERNCVTIAAFLILRSVSVSMECPDFCECRDEVLKCRSASLASVPSDLSGKTVSIDLSFNSISILDKNSFDNMPRLDTVVVSDNNIKSVYPEVFWGLKDLRHLDMHNNNIDYIHPKTFHHNPSLSKLDLSRNKLKHLRNVFNSAEELKFLNLSSNNLTYEDLTYFLPIASLQILDLSNNEIETMSEDIFEGMVDLKHLNISGNPRLEYDCRLRTLWALCSERNISCVTHEQPRMVVNLHCGTEEQTQDLSLTDESDGFIKTSEYSTEGGLQEGSGTEPVEGISDVEIEEVNSTETVFKQSTDTSDNDGALTWIIVGSVCGVGGVVLVIGVAFLIRRYICPREETAGSLSPTNSFCYLNTEGHFTGSKRSPRSGNKSSYSQCERPILTGSNRSISRYQDASHIVAEITRVPSFKTRVAAPLNPPEEICV